MGKYDGPIEADEGATWRSRVPSASSKRVKRMQAQRRELFLEVQRGLIHMEVALSRGMWDWFLSELNIVVKWLEVWVDFLGRYFLMKERYPELWW